MAMKLFRRPLAYIFGAVLLAAGTAADDQNGQKGESMPVNGAAGSSMFSFTPGTIGTSFTFTIDQKFNPPKNILALPLLRSVNESADETETTTFVSSFVDGGVTKTGPFMGVGASSCSKITWGLFCDHSFSNPTKLILFF